MKFILGTKEYMTQVFDDEGRAHPATVISAGPLTVTQVKTKEKDGYEGVQVGFGEKREALISKPEKGHFKGLGNFRYVQEFAMAAPTLKTGDKVDLSQFKVGDLVAVRALSKGKGFQGVVKRHHFAGGPRTHGQKHSEREAGSTGGGLRTHIPKGMRMPGRMGGDMISVLNLSILQIDAASNTLVLKGSIPGNKGSVVRIIQK